MVTMTPEEVKRGIEEMVSRYAELQKALVVQREQLRKQGRVLKVLGEKLLMSPQSIKVDSDQMSAMDGGRPVHLASSLADLQTALKDYQADVAEVRQLYDDLKDVGLGEVVSAPKGY